MDCGTSRRALAIGVAGLALLAPASPADPLVSLVETVPVETPLGFDDVPDAYEVWPEMIGGAERRIDWAAFYVSGETGSRLDVVLDALADAAGRGVVVRVMSERGFFDTYPDVLESLDAVPGIDVRLIDFRAVAGGVMHAKYFIVDADEAYVGSQNFDWRAIQHIVEMGVRVRVPEYAGALGAVYEMDWARAEPIGDDEERASSPIAARPVEWPLHWETDAGDPVTFRPAFSPEGHLPDEATWDLPELVRIIDGARGRVHATMLTYNPASRDGTYFPDLDDALRRAAVRGVTVRLLVADWGKRAWTIPYLKSLQHVPNLEVRMVTIPEASTGFVPYARVIHSKYLTADGERLWLGTSNWERGYFHESRNVGIVATHRALADRLDRSFLQLWDSAYAYPVDPAVEYEPPKIRE